MGRGSTATEPGASSPGHARDATDPATPEQLLADFRIVNGQWFLDGRADDVMNVHGKRLGPGEVEAPLLAAGLDVAAFSFLDEGDEVLAVAVVADPLLTGPEGEALVYRAASIVRASLGPQFTPEVCLVDSIPRTESGKIRRRDLRQLPRGTRR